MTVAIRIAAAAAAAALLATADAAAQSACPPGYAWRHASHDCFSVRAPACPSGTRLSADHSRCNPPQGAPFPSCPPGYSFRYPGRTPAQCTSVRPASCPRDLQVNPVNGRCTAGAVPR
jgi:hypothetical protein